MDKKIKKSLTEAWKRIEKNLSESYLEVRTKTEVVKDYTLSLVTLVRITKRFENPQSLKETVTEEEIYRKGFEDTTKATEVHDQIVDLIRSLHTSKLLQSFLK